jgi:hypothetical protein
MEATESRDADEFVKELRRELVGESYRLERAKRVIFTNLMTTKGRQASPLRDRAVQHAVRFYRTCL